MGRKVEIPIRISPAIKVADIDPTLSRLLHSHGGSIGSAARRSTATVAPSATTAPPNTSTLCGEVQPHAVPPCSSPKISSPAASSVVTAPA